MNMMAKSTAFMDSIVNWLAGLGVPGRDKAASAHFVFNLLSRTDLEAAYRGDWIARKVIDIPAKDATREWRAWQTSGNNIEKLEKAEKKLDIQRKLKRGMQLARLYGGAALVIGSGNAPTSEELVPETAKKDDLKFIHAIPHFSIATGPRITDLTSPYYGEPEYYTTLTGMQLGKDVTPGMQIHPSRVIRLIGNEFPDPANSLLGLSGDAWGDSVLQTIVDAVMAAATVAQAGATLMTEAKVDIIKMPGLSENIATQKYKDNLTARFSFSNVSKSAINTLVLDKEEEWERIVADFSGIPDMIKVYLLMVSAGADIPATRMLGQSPTGLNSTGESDLTNYYDNVGSEQKNELQPTLSRLDELLIRSALGSRDESIYYDWKPLWQLDSETAAKVMFSKAQVFKIDSDAGLIDPEALRHGRQNQLIEDGVYPGLEEALEEQDALDVSSMLTPEEQAKQAEAEQQKQLQQQVQLAKATGKAKPNGKAFGDATPRTLYVYRPVTNWREIASWAKKQGFATALGSDMHVTICYSKQPVDWMKVSADDYLSPNEDGTFTIKPGGPRMVEKFGEAFVLLFAASRLSWRHESIKRDTGATWDFEEYQPHITITHKPPADLFKETADLSDIEPYRGAIELGPEVFEEINDDYRSEVAEDGMGIS